MQFKLILIILKGMVARMIKPVRLWMAGFTEATIWITLSNGSYMAFAYRGRVMNALQKQANRVRMGTLTARESPAARFVCPRRL